MGDSNNLIGYAGVYVDVNDAKADFELIREAHRKNWIGTYDAALFAKTLDDKVNVLDIDATQRTAGAKAGAIVGAIMGAIFLPSVLVSAGVGAVSGAAAGNLAKGFGRGDIKNIAGALKPGATGILLVADATFDAGAEKLMKKADKFAKQVVAADTADLKALATMY
jgi:uncharacterized membrane protein